MDGSRPYRWLNQREHREETKERCGPWKKAARSDGEVACSHPACHLKSLRSHTSAGEPCLSFPHAGEAACCSLSVWTEHKSCPNSAAGSTLQNSFTRPHLPVLGPHPGTHGMSCVWTLGPFSPRAEPVPQGEAGRSTGNQNTQAERHPSPSVNWLSAGPLLVENARPKSHAIHPTMPSNLPLCGFA